MPSSDDYRRYSANCLGLYFMSAIGSQADIALDMGFTSVIFLSPRGLCSRSTCRLLITRKIHWSSFRHGRGYAQIAG